MTDKILWKCIDSAGPGPLQTVLDDTIRRTLWGHHDAWNSLGDVWGDSKRLRCFLQVTEYQDILEHFRNYPKMSWGAP